MTVKKEGNHAVLLVSPSMLREGKVEDTKMCIRDSLDPKTIDNVKMGYLFEDLIRRFSENAEAGDHYTGRDIILSLIHI